jgi:tetratricopeptide (TPR) repeat protein
MPRAHRFLTLFLALVLLALLSPRAAFSQTTSISGRILKADSAPWPSLTVEILNVSTNEHHTVTTDKSGRFEQWGLREGTYKISLLDPANPTFSYSETHDLRGPAENVIVIDFSKNAASAQSQPSSPNDADSVRFNAVKSHFNAATGAMREAEQLRAQLAATPPDQKSEIEQQLAADYNFAIENLRQAEAADPRLDPKTHAMILSHMANAYDFSGASADAIANYEKSVALSPDAVAYENLAKLQAARAVDQAAAHSSPLDPTEAFTTCASSAALDPATGAKCWKNLGITFDNSNNPREAADAWRWLITLTPNDPQPWLQLAQSLIRSAAAQNAGSDSPPVFPPEAAAALEKCIAVAPASSYATEARNLLYELNAPH